MIHPGDRHTLLKQTPDTVSSPAFATSSEAAAFLRLSKAMVFKLVSQGQIPAVRWGRVVRIPWNWLGMQTEVAKGE